MAYGKYYEEFGIGDLYRHWPGRTITEFDGTWFSLLTMDQNPLYIDANFASQSEHGRALVPSALVFSLAVGMSVADVSGKVIANLAYEKVEFHKPVFAGDTLYAETRVLDKRESKTRPDRGIVYVETKAYNERGEIVVTFRRRFLVPKRACQSERA